MPNELYQPTSSEILAMRPADLRAWLTKRLAADNTLAERITRIVGFTPRWSRLSTIQFAQIALAWASIAHNSNGPLSWAIEDSIRYLTEIVSSKTKKETL